MQASPNCKEIHCDARCPVAEVVLDDAGEGLETAGSAATQEDGDTDSTVQADRARQKAFGRLDTYLDENGGINDPAKAGQPMRPIIGAPSSKCIACSLSNCTQSLFAVVGTV